MEKTISAIFTADRPLCCAYGKIKLFTWQRRRFRAKSSRRNCSSAVRRNWQIYSFTESVALWLRNYLGNYLCAVNFINCNWKKYSECFKIVWPPNCISKKRFILQPIPRTKPIKIHLNQSKSYLLLPICLKLNPWQCGRAVRLIQSYAIPCHVKLWCHERHFPSRVEASRNGMDAGYRN